MFGQACGYLLIQLNKLRIIPFQTEPSYPPDGLTGNNTQEQSHPRKKHALQANDTEQPTRTPGPQLWPNGI